MKWSERFRDQWCDVPQEGEWTHSRDGVFYAVTMMINQYLFVAKPLSYPDYQALRCAIQGDWRVILKHVSAQRITTSSRAFESGEVEAMLVSVHCLAMITWMTVYNKFFPEKEEDVIADTSAAQEAVAQLVRFGLMRETGVGGKWTAAGIDMLNGKLR